MEQDLFGEFLAKYALISRPVFDVHRSMYSRNVYYITVKMIGLQCHTTLRLTQLKHIKTFYEYLRTGGDAGDSKILALDVVVRGGDLILGNTSISSMYWNDLADVLEDYYKILCKEQALEDCSQL